ncbi:MAG: ABC transporter substrate-binding protein [Roseiarcus sp.]
MFNWNGNAGPVGLPGARGVGVIVATKSSLWRQGPEKVRGSRADFAERSPDKLAALLRALYKAAE